MQKYKTILLLLLVAIFEYSLIWRFKLGGAKPDVMLLLVIYIASEENFKRTIIFSAIAGVLKDFYGGGLFGVSLFTYVLAAYIVFILKTKIHIEIPLIKAVTVASLVLVSSIITLFFLRVFGKMNSFFITLLQSESGVPQVFYTCLVMPIFHYLFDLFARIIPKNQYTKG